MKCDPPLRRWSNLRIPQCFLALFFACLQREESRGRFPVLVICHCPIHTVRARSIEDSCPYVCTLDKVSIYILSRFNRWAWIAGWMRFFTPESPFVARLNWHDGTKWFSNGIWLRTKLSYERAEPPSSSVSFLKTLNRMLWSIQTIAPYRISRLLVKKRKSRPENWRLMMHI